MSKFVSTTMDASAFSTVQQAYIQWLMGSGGTPPSDLLEKMSLDDLQQAATAAIATLTPGSDGGSTLNMRMKALYVVALWRDASLAYANRGALLSGAANGKVVELYEGGLLAALYNPSS